MLYGLGYPADRVVTIAANLGGSVKLILAWSKCRQLPSNVI